MSGDSRSTQGGQQTARGKARPALSPGLFTVISDTIAASRAAFAEAARQDSAKFLRLCPGPAGGGVWPCALPLFHEEEFHVRLFPESDHDPAPSLILRDVDALQAERDEYRRLLLMALPLLMDVTQARGAFLRSGVVKQIEAAVRA